MNIDEAKKFLKLAGVCYPPDDETPGLVLNMNDVWGWATAWGEDVPDDQIMEVIVLLCRYGDAGLLYWVSERNECMRSEFEDINRFVDFVRNEERIKKETPESNKRAYRKVTYTLGAPIDSRSAKG